MLAAGAALLCLRRGIGQKRFVPLTKAAGLCLLLGLFQLAPFCMYSMQGIGAGTLVNDLTVNAVEPGQILMMGWVRPPEAAPIRRCWRFRLKSAFRC